jgi:peptidylprolyl isomerase
MRRTVLITAITALSLAACGGSDSDADTPTTETPSADVSADGDTAGTDPIVEAPTTTANPDKPEVEIPDELPTELQRNVLTEGSGPEAAEGDTVIVNYVGVRTSDGAEFDNSYDRGQPFPVTLGTGSVIPGWEQGLIGSQTGEQLQLDIPPDLAYGDQERSEVIGANETLTFVIDVVAVVPAADPEDEPTEPGVELSTAEGGVEELTYEDLIEGDGPALEADTTMIIRYVNFRGDNGVAIESNWGAEPEPIYYGEGLLPGLLEGMEGMTVGTRRAITIPPEDGFGEEGRPQQGLPADTDMIFVVDLLATY